MDWKTHIHAGRFLAQMFSDLTGQKVGYDKIRHSVALCNWIIENAIEDLAELQETLKGILD